MKDPAEQKVVVVSAMGSAVESPIKVTDLILNMIAKAARQDAAFLVDLAALQVRPRGYGSVCPFREVCCQGGGAAGLLSWGRGSWAVVLGEGQLGEGVALCARGTQVASICALSWWLNLTESSPGAAAGVRGAALVVVR
jgi:hypothetical protein